MADLQKNVLEFVARHRLDPDRPGIYRYSMSVDKPTLYSSTYAAMTRSLFGDLAPGDSECDEWAEYFNSHQDEDGLFRDPEIFGVGWYRGDPLSSGRPHLTCHVVTALTCIGHVAHKPIRWLDPWCDADTLIQWLESRDWGERVAWTSNEVMNIGTLLQYARDFHNDKKAGRAVCVLIEWLSTRHINRSTGVWGNLDVSIPVWRSHAVQAAYHFWPLFFYDFVPIPHIERAIDTVLATQNELGGFGWGVHNRVTPQHSSACEDIDSIDPLARMSQATDYRRADIHAALTRAREWVLKNKTADGGFEFMRGVAYEYGHPELRSGAGEGAMFPTWFRTLSLALIDRALADGQSGQIDWHFVTCPGYQFWRVSS